jgi:hypothetical protein
MQISTMLCLPQTGRSMMLQQALQATSRHLKQTKPSCTSLQGTPEAAVWLELLHSI